MLQRAVGTPEHELLGCAIFDELSRLPTGNDVLASGTLSTTDLQSMAAISHCMMSNRDHLAAACPIADERVFWAKLEHLLDICNQVLRGRGLDGAPRVSLPASLLMAPPHPTKPISHITTTGWTRAAVFAAALASMACLGLIVGAVGMMGRRKR